MDESTFKLEPHIVRGWFKKGSRPTIKYISNRYQKFHVFGSLADDEVLTKITNKINAKKYLPFIKRLYKRYRKLCIIIDNARWHLTKKILDFIKIKKIKMIRLLPYSPELNPIEQFWKNIKQYLGTKPIFTKAELLLELKKVLRKKEFMKNVSNY